MKVIKKGVLPANRLLVGKCEWCGCEVEVAESETENRMVKCPTVGCIRRIDVTAKQENPGIKWPNRQAKEFN